MRLQFSLFISVVRCNNARERRAVCSSLLCLCAEPCMEVKKQMVNGDPPSRPHMMALLFWDKVRWDKTAIGFRITIAPVIISLTFSSQRYWSAFVVCNTSRISPSEASSLSYPQSFSTRLRYGLMDWSVYAIPVDSTSLKVRLV